MGWLDRSAGEGASYHGKHVVALLAQRNGAGADHAEILSAIERAEAARDFLFHFRHAGCTFGLVVGERDREVADEAQYGVAVLVETAQQVDRGGLLDAPAGSRIGPLAFPRDVVVAGAAGADVVGAEDDLSLTRRRAKLIGAEQKVAHGLRPRLAGGFFRIQQFAHEMGIAQGMGLASGADPERARWAILDRFTHAARKRAHMQLPASACERQSVMLDHIESDGRHIEHLAPTTYPCVLCRQNRVAPSWLNRRTMAACSNCRCSCPASLRPHPGAQTAHQ